MTDDELEDIDLCHEVALIYDAIQTTGDGALIESYRATVAANWRLILNQGE